MGIVAAAAFVATVWAPMAARAQVPNPKQIAPIFKGYFIQGYDECDVMTSVSTIGGVSICPKVASAATSFRFARLVVTPNGGVLLQVAGAASSQQVRVRLTVRTTNRTGAAATFVDTQGNCPTKTCTAYGTCIQRTTLIGCLGSTLGGSSKNIEMILGAELIDVSSGDVIGRIGMLQ
jgi:hypothetical protein